MHFSRLYGWRFSPPTFFSRQKKAAAVYFSLLRHNKFFSTRRPTSVYNKGGVSSALVQRQAVE